MAHRPCRITSPFSPDCALVEAQHEGAGSPLTSAAEAQSRDTPRDYSPGNSSQEGRRKLYPGPRGAIFPGKCLARKYSFEGHISKKNTEIYVKGNPCLRTLPDTHAFRVTRNTDHGSGPWIL